MPELYVLRWSLVQDALDVLPLEEHCGYAYPKFGDGKYYDWLVLSIGTKEEMKHEFKIAADHRDQRIQSKDARIFELQKQIESLRRGSGQTPPGIPSVN